MNNTCRYQIETRNGVNLCKNVPLYKKYCKKHSFLYIKDNFFIEDIRDIDEFIKEIHLYLHYFKNSSYAMKMLYDALTNKDVNFAHRTNEFKEFIDDLLMYKSQM